MNQEIYKKLTENGKMTKNIEVFKELMHIYQNGSEAVKNEIKEAMIDVMTPYIYHVMNTKFSSMVPKHSEELYHEGVVAILETIDSYDPETFQTIPITYFNFSITSKMHEYVSSQIYKTNRYYGKQVKAVKDAIQYFEKKGMYYTAWDIANRTGLSMKQIKDSLEQIQRKDYECGFVYESDLEGKDSRYMDGPEKQYLAKELKELMEGALSELESIDRILIVEKFEDTKEKSILELSRLHPDMDYTDIKARVARGMRSLKNNTKLRYLYLGERRRNKEYDALNNESMIYLNLQHDETESEILFDDDDNMIISPKM